jgi:hypothetical protein
MQHQMQPALAEVMNRLNDIYAFVYPHPLPVETEGTEAQIDATADG